MVLRSLLATPWILLAAVAPLAAQNPAQAPAAPAPGENVVKSDPIPADLVASAKSAVEKLCTEVVAGRYQITLDRMYPQMKERMAKREGGIDNFNEKFQRAIKDVQSSGITLLSSKPSGEARVYEVVPGKRMEMAGGRQVPILGYTKWLVFVPTITYLKVAKGGQIVERTSYQVAITDKGKYDWTFIDGSTATMADLRGLFITLPGDLKLPTLGANVVDQPKR